MPAGSVRTGRFRRSCTQAVESAGGCKMGLGQPSLVDIQTPVKGFMGGLGKHSG